MTDKKSDNGIIKPTSAFGAAPSRSYVAAPPAKSGRGLAGFALLIALAAAGGSGYLWYQWQEEHAAQTARIEAAAKQAVAQTAPELQAMKAQLQKLLASDENLQIKGQLLGLSGDVQPLKNAMELQKGENDILKGEMKLLRESHDTQKADLQQQQQAIDTQLRDQQNHLAKLDEQLKNLRLTDTGLAENLDALKVVAAKGGDVNAFPLAEADYLLRLADTKLKLERNIPAVLLALDTAQERLKTVGESALAPVQTMLGEAIGSLRGVRLADFSGLAHKLVEMQQQVATLPVKIDSGIPNIKSQLKPSDNATVNSDERPWWDRASEAVWNQFKGIVVIRRVRSDAPPLIAMEEEFFLRQNLQLELESMRLALLRGDAQAYQDAHKLAGSWLATYFDVHDSRVSAFQSEVKALESVQFNTYIPDLAGLNKAFQDALAKRQPVRAVQKTAPLPAEPPRTGQESR